MTGFAATSRYAAIATTVIVRNDGTAISFLRRRFVPDPSRFTTLVIHTVSSGERLDNITAAYIDDPEQFWRLCDANGVLSPWELEEPGRRLRIPLPLGVPAIRNA